MALWFWDASALIKRYYSELGSGTVNAVFTQVPVSQFLMTGWGYAETYASLLRRLNGGAIDLPTFNTATASLQSEVLFSPAFQFLPITDATVFASLAAIRLHNLNSTDAILLTALLEHLQTQPGASACVVASDRRLLRAAAHEGLHTLNPELLGAEDVPAFLAAL